ncbi:hypothetical protein U879_05690 [Defluviimonas sp. 20V17]|uniref:Uncharacterized protein n=1 Tax=Allgaiera indica TaxID=765699 RepID=A0AAN5A166_9RHOB|nr:hypothetical protein [Allgaiera indica]KDB04633.1 hypothetical protein U879_05690 [Defluviimonas sp. 20V17]GHE03750.1 hypothetical protein GCM10008024_28350 [Allgaiera indica]SDX73501.1 hypothetical protein SAMN05444006_1272 [Allgaiera indica]
MPIRHNIADLERGLSDMARRQIPFAVSVAINRTLGDVKKNAEKRLRRAFGNPTPFTLRAFRMKRSSKRRLSGAVYAQKTQAEYLRFAEEGGNRKPRGRAIVVPVRQRVNKYGNLPRRTASRLMARPDVFSGHPNGHPGAGGIYQRTKTGLRLLIAYASGARYRKRLRFGETANKTAAARLPIHIERALAEAMRSAR